METSRTWGPLQWISSKGSAHIEVGKKADIVLIKNDQSPVMFPIIHPYGHIALQANRGDVHTVIINGNIVKHENRLVGIDLAKAKDAVANTVDYLRAQLGEETWQKGVNPEVPETKLAENPYTYTTYDGGSAQWKR